MMGVTSRESFTEKELAEFSGATPRAKAEAIARRGSSLLPPLATIGLALLLSLTGTGLGETVAALLVLNFKTIIATVGRFAPKSR